MFAKNQAEFGTQLVSSLCSYMVKIASVLSSSFSPTAGRPGQCSSHKFLLRVPTTTTTTTTPWLWCPRDQNIIIFVAAAAVVAVVVAAAAVPLVPLRCCHCWPPRPRLEH